MGWDPFDVKSWTRPIGFAESRLFAPGRTCEHAEARVLVDGRDSRFAILIGDDAGLLADDPMPLSWTWSSYLSALISVNTRTAEVYIRHWSNPTERIGVRLPRSAADAAETLSRAARLPRRKLSQSVITRMIHVFKILRKTLSVYGHGNKNIVQVFNLLLDVSSVGGSRHALASCDTLNDLFALKSPSSIDKFEKSLKARIGDTVQTFLQAESDSTVLYPHLLIRHASGHLYQEAHFELERTDAAKQLDIWGALEPSTATRGTQKRDARTTPPELARSLVEQAFSNLGKIPDVMEVLDPACGSGVFLQSALRELESRGFDKMVRLRGFDESPVAVEIARFCLSHEQVTMADRIAIDVDIQEVDALTAEWGNPHAILMNPPFTRWRDMSESEQHQVVAVLGDLQTGHSDKAMPFLLKAAEAVSAGGTIASVLPSSMLDGTRGEPWRAAITQFADIVSLGRFNGYSYFTGAIVEPAYVVLSKSHDENRALTVLIANEGYEGDALRELRRLDTLSTFESDSVFVSNEVDRERVSSISWMPRTFRFDRLLAELSVVHPTVGELFDVRQGALSGKNSAFVLTADKYTQLNDTRKAEFFRPAASTVSIRYGRLFRRQYVFFPYSGGELLLKSEAEVREALPDYFSGTLAMFQSDLKKRSHMEDRWWTLTRARDLDVQGGPKLVSAYFGDAGSFAFDAQGNYVCLHGYMWVWSGGPIGVCEEEETEGVPFEDSDLPFAYVALLNSNVFEVLLSCFCPRVQGGQFNLSKRFVNDIYIPDFGASNAPGDLVHELAQIGHALSRGSDVDAHELNRISSRVYGIPYDEWGIRNGPETDRH